MSKRHGSNQPIPQGPAAGQTAAQVWVEQAQKLLRENKDAEAISLLRKAVAAEPNKPEWQHHLGKQLLDGPQHEEGIKWLRGALGISPDFVPALVDLGQQLAKKGKLDEAHPFLTKAMQVAPELSGVRTAYAIFLQRKTRLPEAIEQFRAAFEILFSQPIKPLGRPKKPEDHGFANKDIEVLLWKTLSQLARAGVHAFPDGGTLLGLVRDGCLLPWDKDIDIGIPWSEFDKAEACLFSMGWMRAYTGPFSNPRSYLHRVKKITLDLEAFAVDPASGKTYYGFWMPDIPNEWGRFLLLPPITLEKGVSPDNEPVWQLQNPDAHLSAYFGNWREPDPDFNSVVGEYNLCGMSLLTECYVYDRVMASMDKGHAKKAKSLVRSALKHRPEDVFFKRMLSFLDKVERASVKKDP